MADGRVPLGARLPAERDLAAALTSAGRRSPPPTRRLREQGWADARQGRALGRAAGRHRDRGAWVPGAGRRRDDRPGPRRALGAAQVPAAFAAALDELPALPARARLPPRRAAGAARAGRRAVHRPRPAHDARAGARHGRRAARRRGRRSRRCCGRGATGCWWSSRPTPTRWTRSARSAPAGRARSAARRGRPGRDWSAAAERALRAVRPARGLPHARLPEPDRAGCWTSRAASRLAGALRRAGTMAVVDETFAELWLDDAARAAAAGRASAPAARHRRVA